MSNLLPKERLESIWSSYFSRLVLTAGMVILGISILTGSALLPSYVALNVEENMQQEKSATSAFQADANPQSRIERIDILRSQSLLSKIIPIVSATTSPTVILKSVLALRPSGVLVNHISLVTGAKGSMVISGDSVGRGGINQFRDALSKDGRFKSVAIPVGTLVGSESGAFTITLSGDF